MIATSSGLVGEFTDYVLPELATGLGWAVVQTNNEMSLQIVAGDYSQDGVVNAADFTVWRNSIGQQVAQGSGADGDRNGYIDDGDFYVWRDFFGSRVVGGSAFGSAGASPSQVVPEPVGAILLVAWLIAQAPFCRIRRR